MSAACRGFRARCTGVLLACLAWGAPLAAQDPPPRPPPDTVPARPDTARVQPDTARADTTRRAVALPDTAPPPPAVRFPAMPLSPHAALDGTEWVWTRDMLLRETPTSLVDLLERIPAVTTFRAGTFVQPEAAAAFGGTAGRVEVELDGFVLDPLSGSTYDLAQVPFGQLREVRVQRRLGLLRIQLFTDFPEEGTPYSRVEAGIGVPAANLFRGIFLAPHVAVGPLGFAIERLDTDGINRDEPASNFSGWAKWAWTSEKRGVQLELLRSTLRREGQSPWPLEWVRQDVVLRARNEFLPGLVGEVFGGRTHLEETLPQADSEPDVHHERDAVQAGARGTWQHRFGYMSGTFRHRDEEPLPPLEVRAEADLGYGPVRVGGEAVYATWDNTVERTRYATLRGQLGRFYGLGAFAEWTRGSRGAPEWGVEQNATATSWRRGWRAGLTLDVRRAAGSIALVQLEQAAARGFGLPSDSGAAPIPTPDRARGFEAHGRFVIWPGWLSLESWYTDWPEATGWTYLPTRSWRTALQLHTIPLESGNLEILGRAEASMRGSVLAFARDELGTTLRTVPSHTTFDAYLQIRVIEVRLFVRWEDIIGTDIEELPGRVYRGPRVFYGVKWNLWN